MNLSDSLTRLPNLSYVLRTFSRCYKDKHGRIYLVGGAVRDLIAKTKSISDLDIVITSGNPDQYASGLKGLRILNGIKTDKTFKTVKLAVEHDGSRFNVDINRTRKESYAFPGSLPSIEWVDSLFFDSARRDFSVNAIAMSLNLDSLGEILDYHNGIDDLYSGKLRILHAMSFSDDPIRMMRLVRYSKRMNLEMENNTAESFKQAVSFKYIEQVSKDRVFDEMVKNLAEFNSHLCFEAYESYNLFGGCKFETTGLMRFELDLQNSPIRLSQSVDNILIKILLLKNPLFLSYNMPRKYKIFLEEFIRHASEWESLIINADSDLEIYRFFDSIPNESAIALVYSSTAFEKLKTVAIRYFHCLKDIKPILTGKDLLSLGVPEGEEIGSILRRLKESKIQGLLDDNLESEIEYLNRLLGRNV